MAARIGDLRWRDLLEAHDRILNRQVERYRGQLIKTTGDGALVLFDGPALAIACAEAIRDALRAIGLEVRAGVHTGPEDPKSTRLNSRHSQNSYAVLCLKKKNTQNRNWE